MSNPVLDELLKFYAALGFTPDMLGKMSDQELLELPAPGGGQLDQIQKMMLKVQSRRIPAESALTEAENTRIRELEAEVLTLRGMITGGTESAIEERDRLLAERKKHASEVISLTRSMGITSANEVQHLITDLRNLGTNLDICFCIDGTESMDDCINKVKQCVVRVAQNITADTGMTARFALVIYRDYCDGALRHQVWNFGSSQDLESRLRSVSAIGGDDEPEDCFGGLWAALTRITWRAPSKNIIWMGDAPQHGSRYSEGKDNYPDGDPDGRTAAGIFTVMKREQIALAFCKLTGFTDKMCAALRQEIAPFGSGLFLEYSVTGDMTAFLSKSIRETASLTAAIGGSSKGKEKPYSLVAADWSLNEKWGADESAEVFTFSSYRRGYLHPLLDLVVDGPDTKKRNVTCRMTRSPFAKGEMRFAYFAQVRDYSARALKCVTKESRFQGSRNSKKALIDQARIQAIAVFLASDFSAKLKKLQIRKKLIYVPVELLQIPTRSEGKNYFSLERFIPGKYEKFNNNNGCVDKNLEVAHSILQTFSHFTYSYSRGILMVTDLQGVAHGDIYKLTDPAIHTAEPKKYLRDATNLGPKGMGAFLGTHTCNMYCQMMNLKGPTEIELMPPLDVREMEEDDPTDLSLISELFNS